MSDSDSVTLYCAMGDSGHIWAAVPQTPPLNMGLPDEFLEKVVEAPDTSLRFLGTARNARILTRLHEEFSGTSRKFEVAAPRFGSKTGRPDADIWEMQQCLSAASVGGWHEFGPTDYATYQLAVAEQDDDYAAFSSYARQHPLMKILKFIPTLEEIHVGMLLSRILDPRWFVDPKNPYRISKVRRFLGQTPKQMAKVIEGTPDTKSAYLCESVYRSWKRSKSAVAVDMRKPENFLYRRELDKSTAVQGALHANAAFVTFMTRNWSDMLATERSGRYWRLFDPRQLFNAEETQAFLQHMARISDARGGY